MLAEAFPRLAIRLRSTFPDAEIELKESKLRVRFPASPAWDVEVTATPGHGQFQVFESRIVLHYECLRDIPENDFLRLISAENLGLRGVSILADASGGRRGLALRSTFLGQKGRTRDEGENLAIDVLSLFRFARLFDDRILRSIVDDRFSYDIYYSQYLAQSIGRNRYINYARSIFQGSTDRVFGQLENMFTEAYQFKVSAARSSVATISMPNSPTQIILRVPEEIPMVTCTASLQVAAWEAEKSFSLVAQLNPLMRSGHFEVNPDGSLVSYVTWKHLTNDLRYHSLDHLIAEIHEAEKLLQARLPYWQPSSLEIFKAKVASFDAYSTDVA